MTPAALREARNMESAAPADIPDAKRSRASTVRMEPRAGERLSAPSESMQTMRGATKSARLGLLKRYFLSLKATTKVLKMDSAIESTCGMAVSCEERQKYRVGWYTGKEPSTWGRVRNARRWRPMGRAIARYV